MLLVDFVWYLIVCWMVGTLKDTDWSMYKYYIKAKKELDK